MNISELARIRAQALGRLEALADLTKSSDPEERREVHRALTLARLDYRAAEASYQAAIGVMTAEELASLGIAA